MMGGDYPRPNHLLFHFFAPRVYDRMTNHPLWVLDLKCPSQDLEHDPNVISDIRTEDQLLLEVDRD